MNVELVYVYSDRSLAERFLESYGARPAGLEHSLTVVLNKPLEGLAFPNFYGLKLLEHDNSGYDIGAFQLAARESSADLCLFLGSHVYFHRPYWLRRMAAIAELAPDNLYGAFATSLVRPHIRTSAFWCSPKLFSEIYPEPVRYRGSGGDRYEFEHGERSLTTRWLSSGRQALLVTWDQVYQPDTWLDLRELQWWPPSQKNLLLRDKQIDMYRDCSRCPAQDVHHRRCQLSVSHQGKHYAGAFF